MSTVYLQTDKDKEFVAHSMQKFFKENGIHFWVTRNPDIKAAIAERFNKTERTNVALFHA